MKFYKLYKDGKMVGGADSREGAVELANEDFAGEKLVCTIVDVKTKKELGAFFIGELVGMGF